MPRTKPATVPPRRCIFCGEGGTQGNIMTEEHYWSTWIDELLPKDLKPEYIEFRAKITAKGAALAGLPLSRTRQGASNTRRFRVVCRRCNNTWMSGMDTAVIPHLTPLILGQPATLDEEAQRTVAKWVTMKMLVIENSSSMGSAPDPIFGPEVRKAFMDHRSIPAYVTIHLAPCAGPEWPKRVQRYASALTSNRTAYWDGRIKNTQSLTWGIGRLLVQVDATTQGDVAPFFARHPEHFIMSQLWPLRGGPMAWPTKPPVSDRDADSIARALNDMIRTPLVRLPPGAPNWA